LGGAIAAGDLGFSFAYNTPVAPLLWTRALNTLLLTGTATILVWLLALPLGVWSGAGWPAGGCGVEFGDRSAADCSGPHLRSACCCWRSGADGCRPAAWYRSDSTDFRGAKGYGM